MTLYGTRRALLRPRRRFVDTFDALLSRWQTVAGTLAVDGGALKASALGDWGNNLITNGEFTTDTTGWEPVRATVTRVDSATDPGAASGGADGWALKAVRSGAAGAEGYAYSPGLTTLNGALLTMRALGYAPSANEAINAAIPSLTGGDLVSAVYLTAENAWQAISVTRRITDTTDVRAQLLILSATLGDIAYFDAVSVYRQNAAAIMPFAPAFRARLAHVSPAAPSVVPAGWMFRYTGPLDYWELRLLPNTDGNDMQIVQVTAGAETVRAEADVDWTDGGTDEVEITARGAAITTRYKKSGGAWTAGPSYASATQGAQARAMGPLVYGTTTARWARAEVDW